jgi:hypothetical protein
MLDPVLRARLLGSIEANRLILLCGAGLSIPAPSKLKSAVDVARACYDKYVPTMALPAAMRDNIDQLAGHFYNSGEFQSLFIGKLVPWNDLVGTPNAGHEAVADLLIVRAAKVALTTNFDPLIEHAANRNRIAMRGALDDLEAENFSETCNPLLKFHGCMIRSQEDTLWAQEQLADPGVQTRIQACRAWMTLKLQGSHLLVVGFWSDWGYLDDVLADVLAGGGFDAVTVVDIQTEAQLQAKAPNLWARLKSVGPSFTHIQDSGASFLEEFRSEFSRSWLRKYYLSGKPLADASGPPFDVASIDPDLATMTCADLYNLRRDAEGRPFDYAALRKEPAPESAAAAYAHILLLRAHAVRHGPWFVHGGQTVRVVHGAGQALSSVKSKYSEPPSVVQPNVVICAGSFDVGVPGKIVSTGKGAGVVHPAPGGSANWMTLDAARLDLAI